MIDGFTAVDHDHDPKPDDVTICVYCNEVLQFTNKKYSKTLYIIKYSFTLYLRAEEMTQGKQASKQREKMKIINREIADFDETGETVSITAESSSGTETFHIQTTDGEYRYSLGCWILTDNTDGCIDWNDYPDFNSDEIISEAEKLLKHRVKEVETDHEIDGEFVTLLVTPENVKIVTQKKQQYLNKDASPYARRFSDTVAEFSTQAEAIAFLMEKKG